MVTKPKEKKKARHYVNNKELYAAMVEFKKDCREAEKNNEERPPIPEYIVECILLIAQRTSHRPNFANYIFREDMVSDGVENCLRYITNFNPDKYDNPFGYFGRIIWFAFLRKIEKEKKELYVKMKSFQDMTLHVDELKDKKYGSENSHENLENFIETFEDTIQKKKDKKKTQKATKKIKTNLEKALKKPKKK